MEAYVAKPSRPHRAVLICVRCEPVQAIHAGRIGDHVRPRHDVVQLHRGGNRGLQVAHLLQVRLPAPRFLPVHQQEVPGPPGLPLFTRACPAKVEQRNCLGRTT